MVDVRDTKRFAIAYTPNGMWPWHVIDLHDNNWACAHLNSKKRAIEVAKMRNQKWREDQIT